MKTGISLTDITIRTILQPGDIGYIIHMHGRLYSSEYGYGIGFESYVAEGFHEFYTNLDEARDAVWICEHNGKIVGFLLLMHRDDTAQLRYFILEPAYRSIGLGNQLMLLFTDHLREKGYRSAYLWTTDELPASAHLYKKYGFRLTDEKPSEAFGKKVVEQRYELTVQ